MKIISTGPTPTPYSFRTFCEGPADVGCGAELVVEYADLFQHTRYHYGDEQTFTVQYTCPVCGSHNRVPGSHWPQSPGKLPEFSVELNGPGHKEGVAA